MTITRVYLPVKKKRINLNAAKSNSKPLGVQWIGKELINPESLTISIRGIDLLLKECNNLEEIQKLIVIKYQMKWVLNNL
jgi:hypothetical protein